MSIFIIVVGTVVVYLAPSPDSDDDSSQIRNSRGIILKQSSMLLQYETSFIDRTPISILVFHNRKRFNDNLGIPLLESDHFYSYAEVSDTTGECTVSYLNTSELSEFIYMVREIRYCYYMQNIDTP